MTSQPVQTRFLTAGQNGASLVLTVHAPRLDLHVAEQIRAEMRAAVAAFSGPVTVDLAAVDFIDSSGLGALVALRKHLGDDRVLRLTNKAAFVEKVLRLTKLEPLFES